MMHTGILFGFVTILRKLMLISIFKVRECSTVDGTWSTGTRPPEYSTTLPTGDKTCHTTWYKSPSSSLFTWQQQFISTSKRRNGFEKQTTSHASSNSDKPRSMVYERTCAINSCQQRDYSTSSSSPCTSSCPLVILPANGSIHRRRQELEQRSRNSRRRRATIGAAATAWTSPTTPSSRTGLAAAGWLTGTSR